MWVKNRLADEENDGACDVNDDNDGHDDNDVNDGHDVNDDNDDNDDDRVIGVAGLSSDPMENILIGLDPGQQLLFR